MSSARLSAFGAASVALLVTARWMLHSDSSEVSDEKSQDLKKRHKTQTLDWQGFKNTPKGPDDEIQILLRNRKDPSQKYKTAVQLVRTREREYILPSFFTPFRYKFLKENFEYKPTDIVLASYVGSGSTWMEQLILMLLNDGDPSKTRPLEKNVFDATTKTGKLWVNAQLKIPDDYSNCLKDSFCPHATNSSISTGAPLSESVGITEMTESVESNESQVWPTPASADCERESGFGSQSRIVRSNSLSSLSDKSDCPLSREFQTFTTKQIGEINGRRVIKTYLPYDLFLGKTAKGSILDGLKVIYLNRHPRDVCVSNYFYACGGSPSPFSEDWSFDAHVSAWLQGFVPYGSWFDHTMAWEKAREDNLYSVLWIVYNDLRISLDSEVDKIAEFLEITLTEEMKTSIMRFFDSVKDEIFSFPYTEMYETETGMKSWRELFGPELLRGFVDVVRTKMEDSDSREFVF